MGENPFEGVTKLYIGEHELNPEPQEGIALEYEIPSQEPLMAFDPALEGGDKTVVSGWESGAFEFNIEFTIDNEDNPVGKWFWNMVRRFRRERKALLWALTHGYTVRVPIRDNNDNEGYIELTLPSQLRQIMRTTKFIPQYRIYDRYGSRCIIRKGKVVWMQVWPFSAKQLKEYTKKLEQYQVK